MEAQDPSLEEWTGCAASMTVQVVDGDVNMTLIHSVHDVACARRAARRSPLIYQIRQQQLACCAFVPDPSASQSQAQLPDHATLRQA